MPKYVNSFLSVAFFIIFSNLVLSGYAAAKQPRSGLTTEEIDQLITSVMEKFEVPGIAVGIVKDGKVIHAKGYGIRNIDRLGEVDEETLFSIASTGKSFTAAALALLVDEGKITWQDKVIDHLPEFRLYDPWVTREFTVKDLLIHNSGLGLGAGDLMVFPSQEFSREEIIKNLRHLKPVTSFRSEFAYDNLLYIVAGEVIAAVSGGSYEDFIDQKILSPLGMEYCHANLLGLKGYSNVANPHMITDGKLGAIPADVKLGGQAVFAAAGGIQCSISSIVKWHNMFLNKGKLPNGNQFLSEAQVAMIMSPQTIMSVSSIKKEWFGTKFSAYGLGWMLDDAHGYKTVQHGGGLFGMLSHNVMVPELNLGITVYTNQMAIVARPIIINEILEAYITDTKTDWTEKLQAFMQQRSSAAKKAEPDMTTIFVPEGDIARYQGTYKDPWFGSVSISRDDDGLYFKAARSSRLKGKMTPYKTDIFIVRWEDRTLNADAYVKFTTGFDGSPEGIKMIPVSPLTDFSFDFHDLNFERVASE